MQEICVSLNILYIFFRLSSAKTETQLGLHVRRGEIKNHHQDILLSSSGRPSLHLHVSHVCVYAEQMVAIAAMTRVHVFTFVEFVVTMES